MFTFMALLCDVCATADAVLTVPLLVQIYVSPVTAGIMQVLQVSKDEWLLQTAAGSEFGRQVCSLFWPVQRVCHALRRSRVLVCNQPPPPPAPPPPGVRCVGIAASLPAGHTICKAPRIRGRKPRAEARADAGTLWMMGMCCTVAVQNSMHVLSNFVKRPLVHIGEFVCVQEPRCDACIPLH